MKSQANQKLKELEKKYSRAFSYIKAKTVVQEEVKSTKKQKSLSKFEKDQGMKY